jgi:hypothetical protein
MKEREKERNKETNLGTSDVAPDRGEGLGEGAHENVHVREGYTEVLTHAPTALAQRTNRMRFIHPQIALGLARLPRK